MVAGTLVFSIANLLHALYIVLTSGVGKNGSTVAVSVLHYPVCPGILWHHHVCPGILWHHPVCPGILWHHPVMLCLPCHALSALAYSGITMSALAYSAVLEPTTYLGLPVHDCVLRSYAYLSAWLNYDCHLSRCARTPVCSPQPSLPSSYRRHCSTTPSTAPPN